MTYETQQETAPSGSGDCGLQRTSSPGLDTVVLARPSYTEIFITAAPVEGEPACAVFDRVAAELRDREAHVVCQDIFGPHDPKDVDDAMRSATPTGSRWPVTRVGDCRDVLAGTQVWAVAGSQVRPLELDGEPVGTLFEDDCAQYCRLGGLTPDDPSRPSPDQAREILERMDQALAGVGMDFSHVARTWFYNDDILSWYGEFNATRDLFFEERHVFDGVVPASTGMSGCNPAGAALTVGLFAVKPKNDRVQLAAVLSPLQSSALDYGSSFSRATELVFPDHRRVLVSGTASITPDGKTVFLDDPEAQVARTLEVVYAILESRGMDWDDVTRALFYFKEAEHLSAFINRAAAQGLPDIPGLIVNNTICRGDLLFEIEVDAVLCS